MKYYIIRFKEKNKYLRSKNLMVYHKSCAKSYSSSDYAKRAVKSSRFADQDFEVIELDDNGSTDQ